MHSLLLARAQNRLAHLALDVRARLRVGTYGTASPASRMTPMTATIRMKRRDFERQQIRGEQRLAEIGDAAENVGRADRSQAGASRCTRDRRRNDARRTATA